MQEVLNPTLFYLFFFLLLPLTTNLSQICLSLPIHIALLYYMFLSSFVLIFFTFIGFNLFLFVFWIFIWLISWNKWIAWHCNHFNFPIIFFFLCKIRCPWELSNCFSCNFFLNMGVIGGGWNTLGEWNKLGLCNIWGINDSYSWKLELPFSEFIANLVTTLFRNIDMTPHQHYMPLHF